MLVKNINEALKEFTNESKARETLKLISQVFSIKNYLIIGGFALRIYDRNARPLTPDIDLLISLKAGNELDEFIKQAKLIDKHYFQDAEWIILQVNGVDVDIKVESKNYEREALNNPNIVNYEGSKLAVVKPEYLALMKLDTMRDKDEQDLMVILGWKNFDMERFEELVRRYLPERLEDLEQLKLIALWRKQGRF